MKLNGIRGQLSFTPSLCLGGGGQLLARRDIQQFVVPNSQNYFNALKFGVTDIPLKRQPGRRGSIIYRVFYSFHELRCIIKALGIVPKT